MIRLDVNTHQLIVSDPDPDALDLLTGLVLSGPLLVIGPPGVGKTAMAADIAKRVAERIRANSNVPRQDREKNKDRKERENETGDGSYVFCQVPMPQVSIVDLYVPVPFQESSGWVITYALSKNLYEAFEKARNGTPGVIVLDDITLAPVEMQPPVQAMTDAGEKTIGGHRIPPTLKIIATGNPESWGGESLLASLKTRVAIVNYLPDPLKWADRFLNYWGRAGHLPSDSYPPESKWRPWRQKVSDFIKVFPHFLYVTELNREEYSTPPSPRGWDLFSRALAWNNVPTDQPNEYDTILLTGAAYLPARIAESFAGFVVGGDMPSPEEILANIQQFVDDAARGKFSTLFGVICNRLARHILDNITQASVIDASLSLAHKLQEQRLNNLYAVYVTTLVGIIKDERARQLAAKNDVARKFVVSVSKMVVD